jgi:conjugal transfer mating pair stabilization protein TraN
MGRIIAEQGRPQLASFGPDGGWGTPENPECRGFTPEEFARIDFAKVDMSEYYQDLQGAMAGKMEQAQTLIESRIRQHYQQLRPPPAP